jgi:hypothetical protein
MAQPYSAVRMPGGLKAALVLVWLQAVANFVVAMVVFREYRNNIDHGHTDGNKLIGITAWVMLGTALLLVACGLGVAARQRWARPTVIALEVVNLLGGVLVVLTGGAVQGLLAMVVTAVVIAGFGSTKGIAWFRR